MSASLVANVVLSGLLTGLVYGLMALGLSVIFGVVRVVNFAHGEMMTVAMYAAVLLFGAFKLDPMLAAMVVGVRQALDYTSTARAVGVCVIGFLIYLATALIFLPFAV